MSDLTIECGWCKGTGRLPCQHLSGVHHGSGTRWETEVPGVTHCTACGSYFIYDGPRESLVPITREAFETVRAAWAVHGFSVTSMDK